VSAPKKKVLATEKRNGRDAQVFLVGVKAAEEKKKKAIQTRRIGEKLLQALGSPQGEQAASKLENRSIKDRPRRGKCYAGRNWGSWKKSRVSRELAHQDRTSLNKSKGSKVVQATRQKSPSRGKKSSRRQARYYSHPTRHAAAERVHHGMGLKKHCWRRICIAEGGGKPEK